MVVSTAVVVVGFARVVDVVVVVVEVVVVLVVVVDVFHQSEK